MLRNNTEDLVRASEFHTGNNQLTKICWVKKLVMRGSKERSVLSVISSVLS